MADTRSITEAFRTAMQSAGIPYSGVIEPDGRLHRFTVDGDRARSNTGFYILFFDHLPAGEFGCWKRTGPAGIPWVSKSRETLTPDELSRIAKQREDASKQREHERKQREDEAAATASILWEAAEPCTEHPYLTRKQVMSYGLRVGAWMKDRQDGTSYTVENALLVPVRHKKKLYGLQAIFEEKQWSGRDKDFLFGARKKGCYFPIGKPEGERPTIIICEGYATGASIHEATGKAVIVAFDAGNLTPVAEVVRAAYPGATLIIAADNDQWNTEDRGGNAGVKYGQEAANIAKGWLAVPEFADLSTKPTDFNDLHAQSGLEAVRKQIEAAVLIRPEESAEIATPGPSAMDLPAVDYITPLRMINGKGRPLNTIENLAEIRDRLGIVIRYNVISKAEEILIPLQAFTMDNAANASLAWLSSQCERFGMSTGKLTDYVTYLADQNLYNPVATWVTSQPWDGKPRIKELASTLTSPMDGDLKLTLLTRWLVSAVAAAFEPNGVSAHGVLVLQGEQYVGKTKWFKGLAPPDLGVIKDGLTLRPDDKDSVKQAVSFWLVELGELDATFRKSDIAALKSFLTNQDDVLRLAYAKRESRFARRTVFFGSVNPNFFLHDTTGNRRYWTIPVVHIEHDHGINMQQLWAEAHHLYTNKHSWFLTADELHRLNGSNEDFQVVDPAHELVSERLNWDAHRDSWRWITATQAAMDVGIERPNKQDTNTVGTLIRQLNGGEAKKSGSSRLLLVPPKVSRYFTDRDNIPE